MFAELVDLNTPPVLVEAYSVAGVAGLMANLLMPRLVNPLLRATQVAPESVDLNTPAPVPAYSVNGFNGSIASAATLRFVRPVFAPVHVAPELVDLKTPAAARAYVQVAVQRVDHQRTNGQVADKPLLEATKLPPWVD